jgi:uncharacterized membrane protein
MARRRYWSGFAAGAAAGLGAAVGGLMLVNLVGRSRYGGIVRLQKTLQIGRPVEEVFNSWAELERLPQWSSIVQSIRRNGDRSHWVVEVSGRRLEWDAEVEQFIPNQAIGWKSLNGPKHTGRISFSPVGNDTLVNVTMNYAPPSRLLRPFIESNAGRIEEYLDQVLREFKQALEGKGSGEQALGGTGHSYGTYGTGIAGYETPNTRFGGPPSPLEYTRPPESKS